jgi:hypothetical protein
MTTELFGLLKAALWPLTTLIIVMMYKQEIRNILIEVPSLTRRLLSLKTLGTEISLDSLSRELPKAEEAAKSLVVPELPKPEREPKNGNV